jgi:hypothetical protein
MNTTTQLIAASLIAAASFQASAMTVVKAEPITVVAKRVQIVKAEPILVVAQRNMADVAVAKVTQKDGKKAV